MLPNRSHEKLPFRSDYSAVRDAVDAEVKQLRVHFDRWQGLLQSSNTTDVPFQVAHDGEHMQRTIAIALDSHLARHFPEFGKELRKTQDMVRKVKATVIAVERNRVKFPHIDDRELASRKAFMGNLESVRMPVF